VKTNDVQSRAQSSPSKKSGSDSACGDEGLMSQIAVAAYYRAEARGFEPGHEIEDWEAAEAALVS
jgi:hypothetical protein